MSLDEVLWGSLWAGFSDGEIFWVFQRMEKAFPSYLGDLVASNEVILKGRTASTDGVVYDVEGFASCWFRMG